MDLFAAGLWYQGEDRFDPGKFPPLSRRPPEAHEAYKSRLLAYLGVALPGKTSLLDEILARPRVVVVGADVEAPQINGWLEALCDQGARWREQLPPPPATGLPCGLAPFCSASSQVQLWCIDCWNRIEPEVQRQLVQHYRPQQAYTGSCSREWMAWAQKTPSLRSI